MRRAAAVAGAAGLVCALLTTLVVEVPCVLVWNSSASMPRGLYGVVRRPGVKVGDAVVAWLPPQARRLAAARGYLADGVPLVKRIAAGPGDPVCVQGLQLRVGRRLARARPADTAGRPMPTWRGCGLLADGTFLLLGDAADSFDSRYFGPVRRDLIVGLAIPLWRP